MPAPHAPADGKPTVLIVEDDPAISYLLNFMLARKGYAVEIAADGDAGHEWIARHDAPDVAVLDVSLPRRDGLSLLEEMRARPGWEDVPVIMLSARDDEATLNRAMAIGASDYLSKPFDPAELVERIERNRHH